MQTLTLNHHCRIAYRTIPGDTNTPWLIFLHEGLGSMQKLHDFPDNLCQITGCSGLLFDRQGHGLSDPLKAPRTIHYLHQHALVELPQVIHSILKDQAYFVLGHSDGGSIALLHAAEQPSGLLGVITEAAHVFNEDETRQGIHQAESAYRAGKLERLRQYHGDKTDSLFYAWADTWRAPGFASWNIEYALPAIDCPVLAIQGQDDAYGTPEQLTRIRRGTLNSAETWLISDCGHTPHREQTELVLQRMAAFISTHMETNV